MPVHLANSTLQFNTMPRISLGEANRLEAATKSTRGTPEITSTMIRDANILLRRGYSRPPKGSLLIISQIASTVGALATGLLANTEKLNQPGGLALFVLVLVVTITATVLAFVKD